MLPSLPFFSLLSILFAVFSHTECIRFSAGEPGLLLLAHCRADGLDNAALYSVASSCCPNNGPVPVPDPLFFFIYGVRSVSASGSVPSYYYPACCSDSL